MKRLETWDMGTDELQDILQLDDDQEVVDVQFDPETKQIRFFIKEDVYTCSHVKNYNLLAIAEKHCPWTCTLCGETGVDEEVQSMKIDELHQRIEAELGDPDVLDAVIQDLTEQGYVVYDLSDMTDEEREEFLEQFEEQFEEEDGDE